MALFHMEVEIEMNRRLANSHPRSPKHAWAQEVVVSDSCPEQEALAEPQLGYTIEGVMTADEVASLLRLDRKTIYTAAKEGQLPCLKIGRQLRFSREAVLQTMAQGLVEQPNGGTDGRATR